MDDEIMATLREVERRQHERASQRAAAARAEAAERKRALDEQTARRPLQEPSRPPASLAERLYYGRR